MKCQNCGKQIASNNKTCPYCGNYLAAQGDAWYKKWWIWLIAAAVAAGVVVTCVFAFGGCGKSNTAEPVATTVAVSTAASTESTTAPVKTVHEIISEGYEKISLERLYKNINTYKNKKIVTAVPVKDIGTNAVYSSLEENGKTLTFYKFNIADAKDLENVKKDDYAVIYGTVDKNGSVSGTIEVNDCQTGATGDDAKLFFDSLKKEDATAPSTAPTTKPATTAPTTKPVTTAPVTTAPVTTVPATTVPATTVPSNVLFNQNGLKVTYLSMDSDDAYVNITLRVENKSQIDYEISAENGYVNGTGMDILGTGDIYSGDTGDTELYLKKSDLENAGITSIDELVFNLLFSDENGYTVPIRSGSVTLNP